jgi:hypothetical protein
MNQQSDSIEATKVDAAARLRRIRSQLPGQVLRERIDTARACYGPLYTMAEVRRKVADTLPRKLGFARSATLEPIETFGERIPDEAVLKYDDAVQSGVFSNFWVATPTYYREHQVDPWIIGEVKGTELCAVIAQWDVG